MSWHNHTGAYPFFSHCATPGLSVGRYKAAMDGEDGEAWAGFAITEHAFAIANPDPHSSWPEHWYNDRSLFVPETVERRIGECLNYYGSFRDNVKFFTGIEIESDANGELAVPKERLGEFGIVIASVHCEAGEFRDCWSRHFYHLDKALKMPAEIMAHPVRRLRKYSSVQNPLPHEIVDETLDRIKAAGMAVEINAHYPQLHDDVLMLRGAAERGMRVAFSMDLHYPEEFGNWRYFEDVCVMSGVNPDKDLRLFEARKGIWGV